MKAARIAFLLVCGTLLASCAHEAPTQRVSPDYLASGNLSGVRAFLYGQRTVVEFAHAPDFLWIAPAILSIKDENGVDVGFEKEGRYYRLSRKLDHFTIWVNSRSLVFQSVRPVETALSQAPVDTPPTTANRDEENWLDVRELSETQLAEIRRVIDTTQTNTGKMVSDYPALDRSINAMGSRPQGKAGAHIATQDAQSPTIKNLSARGSIAMVYGTVPQTRNLSARGSLAQVMPSQKQEHKASLSNEAKVTGL